MWVQVNLRKRVQRPLRERTMPPSTTVTCGSKTCFNRKKMRHDKTENMEVRESSVSMTRVVLVNGSGFIGHRVRQSPSRSRSRTRRLSLVQQLQHTLSPPCELIFAELVSARDHARVHESARDLNVVSMWRPDAECSVLCAPYLCDVQTSQSSLAGQLAGRGHAGRGPA